jgi:6-phosphogluconolactonase
VTVEIHVRPTAEEAAREAAEHLARTAAAGGALALAGGSTPRRAYELAAAIEPDWRSASVWWGDERCVPPDDARSNYLLARRTLLSRLRHEPSVHRIRGELGAEEAAADYDRELDGVRLDLALLGIGPDGHTASLFPHAPTLAERNRHAVAAEPGLEPLVPRVTLTIPTFAAAGDVLFLVAGGEKADAVRRAFSGEPGPDSPASLVRSESGTTLVVLDADAAARLDAEARSTFK